MASNSPKAVSALTNTRNSRLKQLFNALLALGAALLLSSFTTAGGPDDSDDYPAHSSASEYQTEAEQFESAYDAPTNTPQTQNQPAAEHINAASSINTQQANQDQPTTEHIDAIDISPYQAVYQSSVKGITAELQQNLSQTKTGQWQLANAVTILFAGFDELSQFSIENGQVRPTLYHYNNPMSKGRSSELHFDQQLHTVVDKDHPKAPLKITPSTTDKLSGQLQIRLDLIREGQAYNGKAYSVVDSTKLKTYHTEVIGEETIKVLAGEFKAIKVKQFRQGKDKHTLIWLAKNHQYLILRLDVIDKGKLRDSLQLKQATIDGRDINR